jgi:hypothetical protein
MNPATLLQPCCVIVDRGIAAPYCAEEFFKKLNSRKKWPKCHPLVLMFLLLRKL